MRKVIKLFIFGVLIGTFVGLWLSIAFSGIATKGHSMAVWLQKTLLGRPC